MKVWIITYDHRHGNDVLVCATEELADREVTRLIRESIDELPDEGKEAVTKLLDAGDVAEAAAAYTEWHGKEWLTVYEDDVITE